MRKEIVGIAITMFLVFSFSVAYARDYYIGSAWIQYRVYETGPSINRLTIGMKYSDNDDWTDENVITNVIVFNESNNEVTLGDVEIETIDDTYPRFNSSSKDWEFFGWRRSSWYGQNIQDDLIQGENYKIVVEDLNGTTHEYFYLFRGQIDLPIVKSSTFKYGFDEDGNFYWQWNVPKEMFYLGPSFFGADSGRRPMVRAMIDGYQNGEKSHNMWIEVPYLMNGVYVPASWGFFDNNYDHIEIGVQVQIQDFSNRTISNMKTIKIK